MNKNDIQDKLKQMEQEMADLRKKLDEPELLPCPFCGNPDLKIETEVYSAEHLIGCNNCGAKLSCGGTREDITFLWNRRSKDPREEAGEECKKIISKWIAKLEPGWKPDWKRSSHKYYCALYFDNWLSTPFNTDLHHDQDEWYFPEVVAKNKEFRAEIEPHFRKWLGVE